MTVDLKMNNLTVASTVMQGLDFNFSYTIQNIGNATSAFSNAAYMFDQMADPMHYAGFDLINQLTTIIPLNSQTQSDHFNTAGLSVGQHTLYVVADNWDQIGDTNRANNVLSLTFQVTAPIKPDLVVSQVTAGLTAAQGGDINFVYAVKNIAAGLPSAYSNAAYYVDQMPDPNHYLGFNLVVPLTAGTTEFLNGTFNTAGLSVGTHTLWVAADNWGQAGDGNPANNFTAVSFTVTAPLHPDLAMNSMTVPAAVMQGLNLNFSYSIKNNGNVASGFSNAAYYFDQLPDPTHYAGFDLIGPVAIGGILTRNDSFNTAGLSVGTHTLYVMADNWDQIGDINRGNNGNLALSFTITAPILADLVVNGITADASVAQGNDLHFSYQIKNIAAGLPSAFSNAAYYIDQKPDPNQFAGFNLINPLAAGAVSPTLNDTFNTAGLSVGQHTLWIAADNWNQAGDGNPLNNFLSINFTVAPPLRPDLRVSTVTVPINTMQGLDFNFSYSVQNIGTAASAFSNAAYYFDQMPDPTHYAGFDLINPLTTSAPQNIQTQSDHFNTAGLSVGQHTLYVAADNWNQVGDSNPGNNVISISFNVTAPVKPDLIVNSITAPVSVVQGNNFNFSYVVKNIAAGVPSAFSNAAYYIDQQPDPNHYLGFNLVNQLPAGTVQGLNGTFDTSFLTVGSHTLWVAADNWNQAGDSNPNNNLAAVTFQVTATSLKPDLIVSAINAPSSVVQGATFNFSYDVKNVGQFYAGNSWGAFYIDTKPDATHYVNQNPVGVLLVGQSATLNTSFSAAGLSIGQHTLWVDADNQGNVTENNEANNWTAVAFTVTAPAQLASAGPAPASSPAALSGAVDTGLLTQYMASLTGSSSVSTAGMVFPDLLQAPSTNPLLAQPHA